MPAVNSKGVGKNRRADQMTGAFLGQVAAGQHLFVAVTGKKCHMCLIKEGVDKDPRTTTIIQLKDGWCPPCLTFLRISLGTVRL